MQTKLLCIIEVIKGLVLCLSVGILSQAKAQIIAGDSISSNVYYNNIPDVSLNSTTTFFLDVTNDGVDDIKFFGFGQLCGGALGCHDQYYDVIGLTGNIDFIGLVNPSNAVDTVLQGTMINTSQYWKNGNVGRYYHHVQTYGGTDHHYGLFWGSGDKYLGFRINNPGDTLYGWLMISEYALELKSYAIQISEVGIKDYRTNKELIIYPNPVQNKAYIKQSTFSIKNETVLYNTFGIEQKIIVSNENEMDLSQLTNGIYQIIIKTSNGNTTQKIVVQH